MCHRYLQTHHSAQRRFEDFGQVISRGFSARLCPIVTSFSMTSAVAGRNIHMRYIISKIVKEPGISDALLNLDQSKAFDGIDNSYLEVVFRAAGFDPLFHGWITAVSTR